MAAQDDAALPFRVTLVEREISRVRDRAVKNTERLEALELARAGEIVEVREMREDIGTLKRTLDKLIWAIVGLALTVAASAIGIALTIAGGVH